MSASLVGSEMCIRDRIKVMLSHVRIRPMTTRKNINLAGAGKIAFDAHRVRSFDEHLAVRSMRRWAQQSLGTVVFDTFS
eukprot:8826295-Alexandrium_andersonii.AAC.1